MKKLTVVGRGTVGCFSVMYFLRRTDWFIEWLYDPEIPPVSVGEGTGISVPRNLYSGMVFTTDDMLKFNSTLKLGIMKRDWGKLGLGNQYLHGFPIGLGGIHFSAIELQKYLFDILCVNPRVKVIEQNKFDYSNIDSDFILDCSGTPKDKSNLIDINSIPVNACFVSQCPWDSMKFDYTQCIARPWGWVFGIPLRNRCSIGYVYNSKFADLEEIKKDVQPILNEFGLSPIKQFNLNFSNYCRKVNFDNRVAYNGNASYFLEPLEATSTGFSIVVNDMALTCWMNGSFELMNQNYISFVSNIEKMICLHYFSGSSFKNDFWKYAQEIASNKFQECFNNPNNFTSILELACSMEMKNPDFIYQFSELSKDSPNLEVGTWSLLSYVQNLEGLGMKEEITQMFNSSNKNGYFFS